MNYFVKSDLTYTPKAPVANERKKERTPKARSQRPLILLRRNSSSAITGKHSIGKEKITNRSPSFNINEATTISRCNSAGNVSTLAGRDKVLVPSNIVKLEPCEYFNDDIWGQTMMVSSEPNAVYDSGHQQIKLEGIPQDFPQGIVVDGGQLYSAQLSGLQNRFQQTHLNQMPIQNSTLQNIAQSLNTTTNKPYQYSMNLQEPCNFSDGTSETIVMPLSEPNQAASNGQIFYSNVPCKQESFVHSVFPPSNEECSNFYVNNVQRLMPSMIFWCGYYKSTFSIPMFPYSHIFNTDINSITYFPSLATLNAVY